MGDIRHHDGGKVDIFGLNYDLGVKLTTRTKLLDFGRTDQIVIHGDHLINFKRDTHHSLVFFREGENLNGEARLDGKRVSHRGRLKGKIDVMPAGAEFSADYIGDIFNATVLSIDPGLADLLPSSSGVLDFTPQMQLNDNFLQMMCEQFTQAHDPLLQESLLMTLLVYLSRTSLEPQTSTGLSICKKRILTDYVEEHLANSISIKKMSELVNVSTFHFSRLFKASFGASPYQYILKRRVERAKILLSHTTDRIEVIGFKCGFNGGSQFSQTFSRLTNMSPSAYRKGTS
ncbi:helix-turn-helix domain-containing protein [Pseudomonas protegens]